MKDRIRPDTAAVAALALLLTVAPLSAQNPQGLVGLGDSVGEGVQSADANALTQSFSYLNWIAMKMGVPFALPLIVPSPLGVVGETNLRVRIDPTVEGDNLSVSGASLSSVLRRAADATTVDEIDSETDLVLFPRQGTQLEIAEALDPGLVICWIGNNDALRTATSWDELDGSQLTSELEFMTDFDELSSRLEQMDSLVAFVNVPNVTDIAFLFDNDDLTRFTGTDFGLPDGHRTSLVVVLLLRLGLDDGSILANPDFVLDPSEAANVEDRIAFFNDVIAARAADIGAPVLDMNAIFGFLADNPVQLFGIPVTRSFLGGLFSLDAVHPSNTTHAIVADAMIGLINSHYGSTIPRLTPFDYLWTVFTDPHIDKDGDLLVTGRPGVGLLETLGPILGFTGDPNDFEASVVTPPAPSSLPPAPDGEPWTRERVLSAFASALAKQGQ